MLNHYYQYYVKPEHLKICIASRFELTCVGDSFSQFLDPFSLPYLWEYEKVLICDVNNGNRWETYVLPGEYGSGVVSVQGAGARLCNVGDCLIILSFEVSEDPIDPQMILVNRENKFVEYLKGAKYEQPFF